MSKVGSIYLNERGQVCKIDTYPFICRGYNLEGRVKVQRGGGIKHDRNSPVSQAIIILYLLLLQFTNR